MIDVAAKKDCYALAWSLGEVCVECGCCSDDPAIRIPARIKYCEDRIQDLKDFDDFVQNEEHKALQMTNIGNSIAHYEKELNSLRKERIK